MFHCVQATGSRVGSLVETTVGLLLAIVIAFVYSWLMTLVVLGVVPVLIIAGSLKVKALSAKNASVKLALEEAGRVSSTECGRTCRCDCFFLSTCRFPSIPLTIFARWQLWALRRTFTSSM